MNKKTKNVLSLVILVIACLVIFAACNKTADINTYSEEDLGVLGKLVFLMHKWIGNYGWTVVVFTVFLKILMLPLEFWQRYAQRKSSLKMQQMQPVIEEIDKRYGANTQRANEEKQKLYKKQGFSMMSSCLPMLVTMAVFIIMFTGLRNYSQYSSINNFKVLSNEYYQVYSEQILDKNESGEYIHADLANLYIEKRDSAIDEAKDDNADITKLRGQISGILAVQEKYPNECETFKQVAIEAVQAKFEETRESWLWIQNVWQPDTWASILQPYEGGSFAGGGFSTTVNLANYPDSTKGAVTYEIIRNAVLQTGGYGKNGTWNGLMILPVLSIGLSFLSTFISQRIERKNRKGEVVQQNAQQATTNKMMMIIMPLMMAWFGFIYTGAFAIYMVVNHTLSIVTTVALRKPVEMMINRKMNKDDKKNKSNKASYMR